MDSIVTFLNSRSTDSKRHKCKSAYIALKMWALISVFKVKISNSSALELRNQCIIWTGIVLAVALIHAIVKRRRFYRDLVSPTDSFRLDQNYQVVVLQADTFNSLSLRTIHCSGDHSPVSRPLWKDFPTMCIP
jgi:hypothetical protein